MDLFEYSKKKSLKFNAPLAERVRPLTIDDFYGQEHILYKNSPLNRLIKIDRIGSLILYGPPGTGKTTLAMIISNTTKKVFEKLSAVTSGVKDIKEVVKNAEDNLSFYNKETILFIDEIHRFNKSQQDALLPHVENGLITLIGATTENPYFEVNKALLSRCKIVHLKSLKDNDLVKILQRALNIDKILSSYKIRYTDKDLEYIARLSSGDVRNALNTLEVAVLSTEPTNGVIEINNKVIKESVIDSSVNLYDKNADYHYNTISAFIKSMRGSDPDASILYLAKMLKSGEDPKFIARRMVIFASEDIGNADPNALTIANNVFRAVEIIGLPEARINLAQGVTYLATAKKSNKSYLAIEEATKDINENPDLDIPQYLRDSHYLGAENLGIGIGYKYPHDFENSYVKQRYFPMNYNEKRYYKPTENGYEKNIKEYIDKLKGE
ncbi:replication-associated recombination protein A [Miniphocaeibacter massiliensis]|uniref:replication-associated recombination protein A n=1 Tax=Miniphocaeibacter massiliensis TaxID=2041841 RepID=UPI000C074298|nr:replication-associated recombination protein A [Miniphocaeibacter massiliensis]